MIQSASAVDKPAKKLNCEFEKKNYKKILKFNKRFLINFLKMFDKVSHIEIGL